MAEFGKTYGTYRHWEMLPGILLWTTFLGSLLFSFIFPIPVIIFIILFDLYWLFRVNYNLFYLIVSAIQYHKTLNVDWEKKVRELPGWERIHHVIFLPTYKENIEILRSTFSSLQQILFPLDRVIIVLAGEERDHQQFQENAACIQKEFGSVFQKLVITEHPANLPDEIKGKGSNLHYSAGQLKHVLETEFPSIPSEDIVVSSFDVDTVVHPHYFAHLTYLYLTVPDPTHASYQPVALFSNNIWTSPAPVRIAAFGTTFWLMTELARPDRLWTFSSHSMPWKMLLDVGFWQKDIVSEDSRIFLQGFLAYHGDYRVVPMYLPVSMDTVTGKTYLDYLVALYKQLRRWAWGVEHLPFMIEAFRRDPLIPRRKKIKYIFNHIEGMYTWATTPLLIFFLGRIPLYVTQNQNLALVHTAPFTLEWTMRLAMIGLFATSIFSLAILPPRPKTVHWTTWIVMIFQWALVPITSIFFGAFPAIDAQTRLMLGKYLGFEVTKKSRK